MQGSDFTPLEKAADSQRGGHLAFARCGTKLQSIVRNLFSNGVYRTDNTEGTPTDDPRILFWGKKDVMLQLRSEKMKLFEKAREMTRLRRIRERVIRHSKFASLSFTRL